MFFILHRGKSDLILAPFINIVYNVYMNRSFQPINAQGQATEEFLYSELEAREIAKGGETLLEVSNDPLFNTPFRKGQNALNSWVESELVGKGELLFKMRAK